MTESARPTAEPAVTTPVPPMRTKTPFWRAVLALTAKDLRAEWRGRELVNAMVLFAALAVLIFSIALELDREARENSIAGVFWMTVVFAGMLGLSRSLIAEKDKGNLDALLLAPIDRSVLFFGKMISNLFFMFVVAALLMLLSTILFNVSLFDPWFVLVALLGTLGFATVGTLLSSMAVHTRARETMLPILLLPVALPIILFAVRASTSILNGMPQEDWLAFPQLLAVADVIFLALSYLLFGFVVEE
ncbi:MAG: heme exporter protein CcmB [Anaerolineae bacterium]|nr:heme exporter protein CcmB [Anaerolineae bacterium]